MPSNAEYAKINIACKALGIDKYQILGDRYGLETSKDLKPGQVRDLLHHFKTLGWKPKPPRKAKSKRAMASDPQSRKIRALWITLAKGGAVRNPAESALNKYCKRMVGVEALAFATTGMKVRLIEHLKEWQRRDLLQTCGWLLCCLDVRLILIDRKWIIRWLSKP